MVTPQVSGQLPEITLTLKNSYVRYKESSIKMCEFFLHFEGLDNSICTFGSLLTFRRPNTIVRIPLHSSLRVLLVDTKVSRNTRVLVDKVAKLRESHGKTVTKIMEVHFFVLIQ